MVKTKQLICRVCQEEKTFEEMRKHSSYKGGFENICRPCRASQRRKSGEYTKEIIRRHAKEAGQSVPLFTESDYIQLIEETPNCLYCGDELTESTRTIDHIYPKSQSYGGAHIPSNITVCCLRCNSSKQAKNIYDYYQYSERFTPQLWRDFLDKWIGKHFMKRPLTDIEAVQMTQHLRDEYHEILAMKTQESEATG